MLQVRRVIASSALVLLLALAGCGGGGSGVSPSPTPTYPPIPISTDTSRVSGGPTSTPPLSTTPPGSPHPSRTGPLTTGAGVKPGERPPEFPATAKHHDSAGALAMAAYYFKALDWTSATSDPYLIEQIAGPNCQTCERVVSSLAALRAAGGHVTGGRVTMRKEEVVTGTFDIESDTVVEAHIDQTPIVIHKPASSATTTSPAYRNIASLVFLDWSGGRWQVVDVESPS